MEKMKEIELMSINAIRSLSIDAIEKANSGHPGLPMGAAPMAYTLWRKHLNINPSHPDWANRDRFILSAGHGSMLLYALLHLSGFDISIEDLKNFRQWQSNTPGHPEFGITPGVETTTGPLGQGVSNAVGMAIAERMLAYRFNKDNFALVDHLTYVLCGDGDLMEGISAEAASLAGHLKLGKLIYLYDSNDISLDGPTSLAFTESVQRRYESYGWHVAIVEDGNHDITSIDRAITDAKAETQKPSLIIVKTTIGYGSPSKQGTSSSHGAPLGSEEVKKTKETLGIADTPFNVPSAAYEEFAEIKRRGEEKEKAWNELFEKYKKTYPKLASEWENSYNLDFTADFETMLPSFNADESIATRSANGKILNAVAKHIPWLAGGDADLSCSTKTYLNDLGDFDGITGAGRNIHFGVREHAMAAIANGMSYHGGVRPFTATFFSFVDYMRPSIRLAALSKLPAIFLFTHDSAFVGEDGPTHQPVEQLMSIRCMPELTVIRPSDATECNAAWKYILENRKEPVALILSRQNIDVIDREKNLHEDNLMKGAYVLAEKENFTTIIIATGGEVGLALEAHEKIAEYGIATRVVSMPSWEIFEKQSAEYKDKVFPTHITKRVSIEAGTTFGWERYVGTEGIAIGIDRFGASAPGKTVIEKLGITSDAVINAVKELNN